MFATNHIIEHQASVSVKGMALQVVGPGIYFAIAWVFINYLMNAISALFAWNLGYTPSFSIEGLSSLAGTTGWCGSYVAKVFASAPIMAMLISIGTWLLFYFIAPFKTHLRTFVLWFSIAAFIVYYGHVLAGIAYIATGIPKFFMGFVAMYTWARWEIETITIVLVLQAILSLLWPLFFVPHLCKLSPSRLFFENETLKPRLFTLVFLLPMLVGTVLMLLASFPFNLHYLILQLFACLLVLLVAYFGLQLFHAPALQIVKGGLTNRPTVYYLVLAAVLLAAARMVLTIPVRPDL